MVFLQNNHLESGASPDAKPPACKYLSVVWCKMSKKKHKKWEGDGDYIFTFLLKSCSPTLLCGS